MRIAALQSPLFVALLAVGSLATTACSVGDSVNPIGDKDKPGTPSDPSAPNPPKDKLTYFDSDTDEGMWLVNQFPNARLKQLHNLELDKAWLDHAQKSAVRVGNGCSGSFVSDKGLVMTNHHCARSCVQSVSTAEKNFLDNGYNEATEAKCPADFNIKQLIEITDVTQDLEKATADGKIKQGDAIAQIEKTCAATAANTQCDVVNLYHGGLYHLYKYHVYSDVRLVFAPESSIAFFGGDPDNFSFPRFDLDVTYLRVYENDRQVDTSKNYFKWSKDGAAEGETTFVVGHPGSTSRLVTQSELDFKRDVQLPYYLKRASELRGTIADFRRSASSDDVLRSASTFFSLENSIKGNWGRFLSLVDTHFLDGKKKRDADLKEWIKAHPDAVPGADQAWDSTAKAMEAQKGTYVPYTFLESLQMSSKYLSFARSIYRGSIERAKAPQDRLSEYNTDSKLALIQQSLASTDAISDKFEEVQLIVYFTHLREYLHPEHPVVQKLLGTKTPEQLAKELVAYADNPNEADKTKRSIKSPEVRVKLFLGKDNKDSGYDVTTSQDPFIGVIKALDDAAREIRKAQTEKVSSIVNKNSELIAKATFRAYGTDVYPDATSTLRIAYGSVKGWKDPSAGDIKPFTTFAGAFERGKAGVDPFKLPASWSNAPQEAKDALAKINLDFCTTNDIIGGNSGSPMVNARGEIVGLIFDGNLPSLGGDYAYDPVNNRSVAVHSSGLLGALEHIYSDAAKTKAAAVIVNEIRSAK